MDWDTYLEWTLMELIVSIGVLGIALAIGAVAGLAYAAKQAWDERQRLKMAMMEEDL